MRKGIFIVIYGINNIGKSTQANRLVQFLKKPRKPAVFVKYPVYSLKPTGPLLNRILRSGKPQKMSEEELQLWYVLNRYQFQPTLKKWLSQGKTVIAEDYSGTGIAWGTAKGASLAHLIDMNKFLVQEDLGILFEGVRKLSSKEKDHLHEKRDELVKRCAVVFRKLQKKYHWKILQVSPDKDITFVRLWNLVKKHVL